jgi:hypothetical protein
MHWMPHCCATANLTRGLRTVCRVDMGSGADELGLDILINCLHNVSSDYVGIKQLSIGGVDDDWPVPPEYAPEVRTRPLLQLG